MSRINDCACPPIIPYAYVEAFPISVSQAGTFLGNIDPFSGGITGAANYGYVSDSGHPINGPTPVNKEGQIFLYDGTDGLNFNVIFNKDFATSDGGFSWDINIAGSITDPVELLEDGNGSELNEPVNNNFEGRWIYTDNSDGGVIGEISGNSWTITIDPISYTNVNSLRYSTIQVLLSI